MLPTTGSTMTAAMLAPARREERARAPPRRCNGSVTVLRGRLAGTPAESGTPSVAAPDPAFTSRKSAWPW